MPADGTAVVSVIVTTRNSAKTLDLCLDSVRHQSHPHVELIVVDNSSGDGTMEIAARYADRVATIGPERSAQRNRGAELASGGHLLFVDSDMVLEPDVVADGLDALRRTGLPAAVIPEQTVGEGFWTRCRILERSCYEGDDDVEAARFYTRQAFADAGGFDVDLMGGEDWDLSRRVARGRRLPRTRSIIRHDEGRTRLGTVYSKRRYYAPGYLRYLRKHGSEVRRQGNPVLRAAYARHWRRLARHPVLTAGMLTLKIVEATAVVQVAASERLGKATATSVPAPYRSSTNAGGASRPLLITFGSVLEPDGGLAVRSRVVAETLSRLGIKPAVVSTREGADRSTPAWARAFHVLQRKPKLGFSWELVRLIRRSASDADLVIVANAMFMPALTLSRVRLRMIWDTNECQTLHYARLPATASNRAKYLAWMWLERWAAARCTLAVSIGDAEASEWRRIHHSLRRKVVTVDHAAFSAPRDGHTSRMQLERHLGRAPAGPVLVFVGTMTAKHNAAAARWIIDVLAPSLPPTTLVLLCGPGSDRLRSGAGGAEVVGLGTVDDVDSVIAAADLCLAPLASGAGVKTKVLHYLAHGRRVAGTPVAFEGLDGAPGLFAASLDELPALVAGLCDELESPEAMRSRSAAQLSWMECHHGRDHIADQWREVLRCLDPL